MIGITSPDKCLLCIALPTTYEEFIELTSSEERSNFVWYNYVRPYNLYTQDARWKQYQVLLEIIMDTVNEVREAGGNVILSFSGKDLERIADYDVVTIVAHWIESKGCLEFFDGFYTPEKFIEWMPANFIGLLDLTVCYSVQLISKIKEQYSGCLTLSNSEATQLEFRLPFYKAIIKLLKISPMSYMDAYTFLMKQLIKYY